MRLCLERRFEDAPHIRLTVYPEAGEAGGQLVTPRRGSGRATGPAADPERSKREAARRARSKVRRYCAGNRLNRLGTLTYAEACWSFDQAYRDVGEFFLALRALLGVNAIPYLWVPEWHPGGHGLHIHFVVGRFVKRNLIEQAWGRGIVHIVLIGDLPVGSGSLGEARQAARYLAPYVSKSVDDTERREPGRHRYEVAQGFQPESVHVRAWTPEHALGQASQYFGGTKPAVEWTSEEVEDWDAPPSLWFAWD